MTTNISIRHKDQYLQCEEKKYSGIKQKAKARQAPVPKSKTF